MKILYLLFAVQHPQLRGPTRHYYFIKELSQRHQITLLALTKSEIPFSIKQEMQSCVAVFKTFRTQDRALEASASKRRFKKLAQFRAALSRLKKEAKRLLQESDFDLIFFHGKDLITAVEDFNDTPIVMDFCDAGSMRYRTRMKYVAKSKLPKLWTHYFYLKKLETKIIKRIPSLAFISRHDREYILGRQSQAPIVPIGIDHTYWRREQRQPLSNCIVFSGVMDYPPNHDAAVFLIEQILPRVRKKKSALRVFVVGRNPLPALVHLAKKYSEVEVTGFVDDIRPYLERATVYVAPIRFASGMQNKLLEAMAMEAPVVTTSAAAAGLRLESGSTLPLLIADNAAVFAQEIVRLMNDSEERARLAAAGRRYVVDHFDWAKSAGILEELCRAAVAEQRCNKSPELAMSKFTK